MGAPGGHPYLWRNIDWITQDRDEVRTSGFCRWGLWVISQMHRRRTSRERKTTAADPPRGNETPAIVRRETKIKG